MPTEPTKLKGILIKICAWCTYDQPRYSENEELINWNIQRLFTSIKITHGICLDCFNKEMRKRYSSVKRLI